MKKSILVILLAGLFSIHISAQTIIDHTYTYTDGPDKNPMKGWNSGWWDDFDLATVGFQYLKWKDFETTDGNFNFSAVEDVINRPGSAGKHLILRLYTDWFGAQQTSDAGPQWLYDDYGVGRLQAPNGKYITDYNDPDYINQVSEAIQALANEYNDDPRIYAIQLGVLGYWGEWHTFSYNDDNFEIEDATMNQILAVYKNNFSNTQLMGRYPWREPLASTGDIGFHNDFFKPNDGHSDEFDNALNAGNQWLEGPIGGEIPPIDNSEQFMNDLYETTEGMMMIETGHYSTMKVGSDERPCASEPNGQKCQGFMAMHRKMGYNFQIESAAFAETLSQSDDLNITLAVANIGVAPIYYDWDVQFALLDQNTNEPITVFEVPFDLKTILPDASFYSMSTSASLNAVPVNDYKLATRLIQPDADQSKSSPWKLDARNTYIAFSNDIPIIDGAWDTNNSLTGGWSILGAIAVDDATLSVNDSDLLENGISVYPNPAKDKLNIVKNDALALKSMQVYDITGRLINTFDLTDMTELKILDITNFTSGIYNLVITAVEGRTQKRLIKY